MKAPILPPSPQISRIRQELSKLPPTKLTVEQARAQVQIHLLEAKEEMSGKSWLKSLRAMRGLKLKRVDEPVRDIAL